MTTRTTAKLVLGPLSGERDEVPLQPDGLPPQVLWKRDPEGAKAPYLRRHRDQRDWVYIHEPDLPPI